MRVGRMCFSCSSSLPPSPPLSLSRVKNSTFFRKSRRFIQKENLSENYIVLFSITTCSFIRTTKHLYSNEWFIIVLAGSDYHAEIAQYVCVCVHFGHARDEKRCMRDAFIFARVQWRSILRPYRISPPPLEQNAFIALCSSICFLTRFAIVSLLFMFISIRFALRSFNLCIINWCITPSIFFHIRLHHSFHMRCSVFVLGHTAHSPHSQGSAIRKKGTE